MTPNSIRKLASVQRVLSIKDIEGADFICAYQINGWYVVDQKGKYNIGDLVIYVEVDSFVPNLVAPFLSKGKEPKSYDGIIGERLRTIKLKKQVSQGLLLSIEHCISMCGCFSALEEGTDVTEWLDIVKYEPPIPAQLAGMARGLFPSCIPKTDQMRIQNIYREFDSYMSDSYEITEKLHGSSCTFFLDSSGEFHVCSRNLDLKQDENNSFWKAAIKYNVESKMREANLLGFALQGELIGEGICGNQYGVTLDFYLFDVFDSNEQCYLSSGARYTIQNLVGVKHTPILNLHAIIQEGSSVESLLIDADGTSLVGQNKSNREGFVYKSLTNPSKSFKVVSNKWLLKNE